MGCILSRMGYAWHRKLNWACLEIFVGSRNVAKGFQVASTAFSVLWVSLLSACHAFCLSYKSNCVDCFGIIVDF